MTKPIPTIATLLGVAGTLLLATLGVFSAVNTTWAGCEVSCATPTGCAPEVVETNITVTDRTLHALAANPVFATATRFQSALAQLDGMDTTGKIQAYKDYLGITDTADFVTFLTARTNADRQAFITTAMTTLELSEQQGKELVEALSKALVGDLL
ncbi:MAG: hypothetical protein OXC68_10445 [Aestuariivita sp.]|nr:hypothetical protein [Aestuariivita sp.]